ncbi:baseplate J/gp47 family protein [Haliea sp.]|uniref:baseplate J/gp47 family protein n=1 Tax=Haliea sp. TaxID=1932666 RepID=UPI00257F63AD|nr:baseplate J/gp47 family protein [Haliea sp.]
MEMASYVGDVMSFYLDNQIQENFVQLARQSNNLFELAYMFGYKPKVTGVATVDIDFFQTVPAIAGNPDYTFTLNIPENAQISSVSDNTVKFLVEDPIDFSVSSSQDPTEVSIYRQVSNVPSEYLLKKTRKAISAAINTTTFTVGNPTQFLTLDINDNNIIGILDIIDSDGNKYFEVDTLGQDVVFDSIKNSNVNDPNTSTDTDAPSLLQVKQVQRRFVARVISETQTQIQFGAGTSNDNDVDITPNPDNVGLGLPFEQDKLKTAFSPTNFLFTNTYGIAPSNTTLTVRYLTGGGVAANVPSNDLTTLSSTATLNNSGLDVTLANQTVASLAVTNPRAASGGQDGDSLEELRQNIISTQGSQLRSVTPDDYLIRALSLPSRFGVISKAFIEKTKLQNTTPGETPSTLDLYVLSYDINKNLSSPSSTLKQNLSNYLSQYRVIGDTVNVKDAFIINIGVDFEILVRPNFNSNEVLRNCINSLTQFFNINNWQINQPIILKDIEVLLDRVEGVQTVKEVKITNKVGTSLGFSQFAYDTDQATLNGVIYPSLDPMIFEVKTPSTDIKGRVVTF